MIIKVVEAEAAPGGKAVMLCDDEGTALPMQVACTLDQKIGEATLTVVFVVDGDKVRIG